MKMTVLTYLQPFIEQWRIQLLHDENKWGDEWKKQPRRATVDSPSQETRIFDRITDYHTEFVKHGTPVPWHKIAGLALIGWIRDTYPDTYDKN